MTSKTGIKALKKDFFYKEVMTFGSGWKLHIHTLSTYYGSKPGSYVMTDVKNISANDNFLSLADNKKNCMDDSQEECKSRSLLWKGLQYSNCTPFGLSLDAKKELVSFARY